MATFIILIDLATLLILARWLYKKQSLKTQAFYWPALTLKLFAGIAVGWMYFYYYEEGDTISYWYDGRLVAEKIATDPLGALNFFWQESLTAEFVPGILRDEIRSLFFAKISGLLALVTLGNYWMMSLIISFISFCCAWYLFIKAVQYFPASRLAASISFLFYPSIVFWSSGLIKESLGLAALFSLAGIFLTIYHNGRVRAWEWMLMLLSLWIGWSLKYYWIGVFVPIALTGITMQLVKRWQPAVIRYELIIWTGLLGLLLFLATSVHPNFYPHRFLEVIWQNNQEFMALSDPQNSVHYVDLQPTIGSVLQNSPKALIAGFFRPFVWDAHNILSLAAALENLMLLGLMLSAFPGLLQLNTSPYKLLVMSVIVYAIILAIFLAMSTPNFGTLSRYKIGFLPFLVFLTLHGNLLIARWMNARTGVLADR